MDLRTTEAPRPRRSERERALAPHKRRAKSDSSQASIGSAVSSESVRSAATASTDASASTPDAKPRRAHILPLHTLPNNRASFVLANANATPGKPALPAAPERPLARESSVTSPRGAGGDTTETGGTRSAQPEARTPLLGSPVPLPPRPGSRSSTLSPSRSPDRFSEDYPGAGKGRAVDTYFQELASKDAQICELREKIEIMQAELREREKDYERLLQKGTALSDIIGAAPRVVPEPVSLGQRMVTLGEHIIKSVYEEVRTVTAGEEPPSESVLSPPSSPERPRRPHRPRRLDTYDLAERGERRSIPSSPTRAAPAVLPARSGPEYRNGPPV